MFAHHSSPWNWQCPVKAQGSVWSLLTRAEFSPVTWTQEATYPITESFSHLITQLWLQELYRAKCSLGLLSLLLVFTADCGVSWSQTGC